jgi:hypothetical protein
MAPAVDKSNEDFTFIMTCLKYSAEKPKINFEDVAKELGTATSKQW